MFEAARLTDPIAHTSALAGFLVGAIIGIALIAAVAFATFTCGFGVALLAGLAAGVGASLILGLSEAIGKMFSSPAGTITSGSRNVFTNGLAAALTTTSKVTCDKHSPTPLVAEGSSKVFINGLPAARKKDAITCGAKIDAGSSNVFIGGGTVPYLPVADEVPAWLRTAVDWAFALAGLIGGLAGLFKAAGGLSRAALPCAAKFIAGFVIGEVIGRYVAGPIISRVMGGQVGHPVDVTTGRKILLAQNEIDFAIQSPMPLVCARFYGSNLTHVGSLGKGWTLPWDLRLQQRDGKIWFTDDEGRETGFPLVQPGHNSFSDAEQCYLACTVDGRYILYSAKELYYDFGHLDVAGEDPAWVQRVEDRSGQSLIYLRDEQDRVRTMRTGGGQQIRLHYSGVPERLAFIEMQHGATPGTLVQYGYDALGQLVSVTDANGAMTRQFTYADGLMSSHTNALGFRCSYVWADIADQPRVVDCRTSEGEHTRFRYAPATRQSWAEDELGRTAHWVYDAHCQIVECTDFDGGTYRLTYNAAGMPTLIELPGERMVTLEYDAASRIIAETDALSRVTKTSYDANSLRVSELVLPDGSCWRAHYDYLGRMTSKTDPLARTESFEYDSGLSPLPLAHVDCTGGRQLMTWNRRGQLTARTDCSGKTTRYHYDNDGQLESVIDALGQATHYQRLRSGAPVKVILADGSTEEFEYDAAGFLLEHRNGPQTRSWVRNARGQVIDSIDPAGRHLHRRYDPRGRLVELTRDAATRYEFAYDHGDRLARETRPDGVEQLMRYDAAGNVVVIETVGASPGQEALARPRRTSAFQLDKAGRMLVQETANAINHYVWDEGDRLLEATNRPTDAGRALGVAASSVSFVYDKVGRVMAEHGSEGTVGYTFDDLDSLTSLRLPHGQQIDTLTYGSGHVHQIRSADRVISDFERDDLHREVLHTQGTLAQRVGYDLLGRRTWQAAGDNPAMLGPGMGRLWRSYSYQASGSMAEQRDNIRGTIDYQYDPAGQLQRQTRSADQRQEKFSADAAGNLLDDPARKSRGQVAGNRLMMWQDIRFEYDAWGNLSSKRKGAHHIQRFVFDDQDRLLSVITEDLRGKSEAHFHYDPLGRRIAASEVHTTANGRMHTVRKRFVWQGLRMAQEVRDNGVSSYIYSPDAAYTPLARVDAVIAAATTAAAIESAQRSARIYHFHTNLVGAPLEATDEAGDLVWAGRYDAWGKVEFGEDGMPLPRIEQPLRFPGQYADEATGLHYNTFRFYDPDVGRYISPDPIGLEGGDNAYAYAPNPVSMMDPLGLTFCGMTAQDKALKGAHPPGMRLPHLHHIIREMAPEKWAAAARQHILDVQQLAKKYGLDINTDPRNFTWATNGDGAHTQKAAEYVAKHLKAADLVSESEFFRVLDSLGEGMSKGKFF
jgi:RHS repeat-associated protein